MMHSVQTKMGGNIFWKGQELMSRGVMDTFLGCKDHSRGRSRKAGMEMKILPAKPEYLVADMSRKGVVYDTGLCSTEMEPIQIISFAIIVTEIVMSL
jgi:hypothetical protein